MLIEQTITKFCISKGIEASEERIKIQASYLKKTEFSEAQIVKAIGELFGETEFFPDASLVIKKLNPSAKDSSTEAQSIVDSILEANTQTGSALAAKEIIGPIGWYVVERFGGWSCITNLTYSDMGTARAQLRRIAEAAIINKTSEPKLEYSQKAKGELTKLSYSGLLE